jgi:hypothetical protein
VTNVSEQAGPGVGFSPAETQATEVPSQTAPVLLETEHYKQWRARATSGAFEAIGGQAAPPPGPAANTSEGQAAGGPFAEPSPEVVPEPSQPQKTGPGVGASKRKQR